ncbi:MAG: hypothetical protein RR320_00410 [Oscillospiraceae bacterium]
MTHTIAGARPYGKLCRRPEDLLRAHPCAACFAMFLGIPLAILMSVGALTAAMIVPISLLLHWF